MLNLDFETLLKDRLGQNNSINAKELILLISKIFLNDSTISDSEFEEIKKFISSAKTIPDGKLYLECLSDHSFFQRISITEKFEIALKLFNKMYYQGSAILQDETYDHVQMFLETLKEEYSFSINTLEQVGYELDDSKDKIRHDKRMLSLQKLYDKSELEKWIGNNTVISLLKLDGSSCSLIYEKGVLHLAKTRGDGVFGENITSKARLIEDIPKQIQLLSRVEVRGEVYCTERNFINLSKRMESLGLEKPMSLRNIVAGILGRKENIDLAQFLSFSAFEVIREEPFSTELEKISLLEKLKFKVPYYHIHDDLSTIASYLDDARLIISDGDYLVDGVVFVYNNIKKQNDLGETAKYPRYKVAFKFQGETRESLIQDIEWSVSRNGVLTPVANIDPVELSGAMISRVTLHNFGLAKNFNLKSNDKILITRSGEVIPKFISVVLQDRTKKFSYPQNCPSCNSKLKINDIWLLCENPKCPAKLKEQILNYVHKAGIDDLSDKRLDELISKGLVESIPDLYRLKIEDLLLLEKVKDKLASKMFENIQKTKHQNLAQFISAIGVEGVSIAKSEKIIAQGYNTLEKFMNITLEKMLDIEGFAEKSSRSILQSLKNKKMLVEELISVGVVVKADEVVTSEGPLSGLKFCITGELSQPRPQIEKLIKQNGGVIAGVSKNLNFLVTNEEESTSSKYVKAQALGIPIINEKKLQKMIEG